MVPVIEWRDTLQTRASLVKGNYVDVMRSASKDNDHELVLSTYGEYTQEILGIRSHGYDADFWESEMTGLAKKAKEAME
ncbi:hypothetical protein HNV12_03845 [Methanococcoides sp. SA1]|nr:hypothetical protein [Methanococcoides sp. SA1]